MFAQEQKKIMSKLAVGIVIAIFAGLSTIVSLLKMLYFRLDDGSNIGGILARPFKQFVEWAYQHTHQHLGWFWEHSSTPDIKDIFNIENGYFGANYLMIFVGVALVSSALSHRKRLQEIRRKIDDQLIEESIRGESARSREQIERDIEIPSSSFFAQFHQLYIAPIIVGLLITILVKAAEI